MLWLALLILAVWFACGLIIAVSLGGAAARGDEMLGDKERPR